MRIVGCRVEHLAGLRWPVFTSGPTRDHPRRLTKRQIYANLDAFTEQQDYLLNAGTEWELPGTLTLPVGDVDFRR